MAKMTNKQKVAKGRREVRELSAEHQGGLRRVVGSVINTGVAYGSTRAVYEAQKAGMWTEGGGPWDVAISSIMQFVGDIRLLGGASDLAREVGGGHTAGRLGGMACQHTLGIRYVDGSFVNAGGEALPAKE
jgi:hypothetical protein